MAESDTTPSLDQLRCVLCDFYLSVGPVRLVGEGYVCGRCGDAGGCVITIYNVVARSFLFPCKYEASGCAERLPYGKMERHEAVCDKQPFFCPSFRCDWTGLKKNITKHFHAAHSDDVVDKTFPVRMTPEERCLMIADDTTAHFVDVAFDEDVGLSLGVMRCASDDRPVKYSVKLSGGTKTLTLNSLQTGRYLSRRDPETTHVEVVHTDVLRYFDADEFTAELSFSEKEERDPLKALECPVCVEYMHPPIYLCDTGHSFCGSCVKRVNVCSFCKSRFTSKRNYALENFSDIVRPKRKPKPHQTHRCPLDDPVCSWQGSTYEEMLAHTLSSHACSLSDRSTGTCNVHSDKTTTLLFHAHGRIFKLRSKTVTTKSLQFDAILVGSREEAERFGVVVEFGDGGRSRMVFHEPCRSTEEARVPFEGCLTIPYEVLVPFVEKVCLVRVTTRLVRRAD